MTDLHEDLKTLGPTAWADVPTDDLSLCSYLAEHFAAGERILNTVPPPAGGTPYHASSPAHTTPNTATSHTGIDFSDARAPASEAAEACHKLWGKPVKVAASQNPLGVALYKTAGKDRHGAWFARRAVHEGLGFRAMRQAMRAEFEASMKVEGGPGAGAVRGLAADKRLEMLRVDGKPPSADAEDAKDAVSGGGQGALDVWHLSAQFPGPTTARDFVALVMTGDDVLSVQHSGAGEGDKDGGEPGEAEHKTQQHKRPVIPRHFMIVSKPVEHPDAPERSGYVRAQYESVEMIREIPLSRAGRARLRQRAAAKKSGGKTDGKAEEASEGKEHKKEEKKKEKGASKSKKEDDKDTSDNDSIHTTRAVDDTSEDDDDDLEMEDDDHDPELNPVEWIMVSRSDPGGGIPRFLVDRGTPEVMLGDVKKFLDWACHRRDGQAPGQTPAGAPAAEKEVGAGTTPAATAEIAPATTEPGTAAAGGEASGGIFANLTSALEAGVDAYAPTSVSQLLHSRLHPEDEDDSSSDTSSVSSTDSFMSAREVRVGATLEPASTDSLSLASTQADGSPKEKKQKLTQHEKDLQKLLHKRDKLDRELARKRAAEAEKLAAAKERGSADADKQAEKMDKEVRKLEHKHAHELQKIEKKRAKEERKLDEKRRKRAQRDDVTRVTRERDDFRGQVALFRRENAVLRERAAELEVWRRVAEGRMRTLGMGEKGLAEVEDEVQRELLAGGASVGSGQSVAERKSADSL